MHAALAQPPGAGRACGHLRLACAESAVLSTAPCASTRSMQLGTYRPVKENSDPLAHPPVHRICRPPLPPLRLPCRRFQTHGNSTRINAVILKLSHIHIHEHLELRIYHRNSATCRVPPGPPNITEKSRNAGAHPINHLIRSLRQEREVPLLDIRLVERAPKPTPVLKLHARQVHRRLGERLRAVGV